MAARDPVRNSQDTAQSRARERAVELTKPVDSANSLQPRRLYRLRSLRTISSSSGNRPVSCLEKISSPSATTSNMPRSPSMSSASRPA